MARDEDVRQLERMIEMIARAIPKEQQAARMYHDAAKLGTREMTRVLFDRLAAQEEEHEQKLRATMELLRNELAQHRAALHGGQAHPEQGLTHAFNENIRRTLRLTKDMQALAAQGLSESNDPSCLAMYGAMSGMAAELRALAETEAEKHINAEKWD